MFDVAVALVALAFGIAATSVILALAAMVVVAAYRYITDN